MKIKSLTIQNFKSYGNEAATFEFSDLNFIFGRNSAGKSTALQALKYFASVLHGNEENNVDEFNSIINHDQEYANPILRVELVPINLEHFVKKNVNILPINLYNRSPFVEIEIECIDGNVIITRCAAGYDGITLFQSIMVFEDGHPPLMEMELYNRHPIYTDNVNIEEINKKIDDLEDGYKEKTVPSLFDFTEPYTIFRSSILKQNEYHDVLINSIKEYNIFLKKHDVPIKVSELLAGGESIHEIELNRFLQLVNKNPNVADLYTAGGLMICYAGNAIPNKSHFISYGKRDDSIKNSDVLKSKQSAIDFMFKSPIDYLLSIIELIPELIFSKTIHIGPLRKRVSHVNSYDKSNGNWHDGTAAYYDIVNSEECNLDSINSKLRLISERNNYKLAVNCYLLSKDNQNEIEYLTEEIRTLSIKTKFSDIIDFSNVGTGISQALPIIIALEKKGKLLIIEQPELHLHPAVTMHLSDLMVDSIKNDNQLFIETHSEHIILRVLRHIRERRQLDKTRTLTPENISVIYVDHIRGKLSPVRIAIDEDGDFITKWPNGFFVERAKELF